MRDFRGFVHLLTVAFFVFGAIGCASFKPTPAKEVPFLERAQTQEENNVRVTAAVLSPAESEAIFDTPLYQKGIQPVWVKIENMDESPIWMPLAGIDRNYFSPLEIAYMFRSRFSKKTNMQKEQFFYDQAMERHIQPGATSSGFVFTNLDIGTKGFAIDVIGEDHDVRTFTFFIMVPGFRADHQDVDWDNMHLKSKIVAYDDEASFRKALAALPCCTTNQDGTKKGAPVNLVIIGSTDDLYHALIRGGWDETGIMDLSHTPAAGAMTERERRHAAMKPLYFFKRDQDAAFRKTRGLTDEKNNLRLWLSPMTFQGKPVWFGQISRDIRVKYMLDTFRIEPDVDEARIYFVQNLWFTQMLEKYAFSKGWEGSSISEPQENLRGDPYFTDGLRAVLWVSDESTALDELEFVRWEDPILPEDL